MSTSNQSITISIINSCLATLETMNGREAIKLEAKLEMLKDILTSKTVDREYNVGVHDSSKHDAPVRTRRFTSTYLTPRLLEIIEYLAAQKLTYGEIIARLLSDDFPDIHEPVPSETWLSTYFTGKLGYDAHVIARQNELKESVQ